jgi:GTP cyclohydrolase I
VQERLSQQVAESALDALGAASVLVVCESTHMCMVARGVEKHASSTVTTACRGGWAAAPAARAAALERLMELR